MKPNKPEFWKRSAYETPEQYQEWLQNGWYEWTPRADDRIEEIEDASPEGLVRQFGKQAYWHACDLTEACLLMKDFTTADKYRYARMQLMRLGYHNHPRQEPPQATEMAGADAPQSEWSDDYFLNPDQGIDGSYMSKKAITSEPLRRGSSLQVIATPWAPGRNYRP
jgi:hypothetical protein